MASTSSDRSWMYKRFVGGYLNEEFVVGVQKFLDFAEKHSLHKSGQKLKCPCDHRKCRNANYLEINEIKYHLYKNGFEENYYTWRYHGEVDIPLTSRYEFPVERVSEPVNREESTRNDLINMIEDAAGPDFDMDGDRFHDETPNAAAQSFYDLLDAGKTPLYPGEDRGPTRLCTRGILQAAQEARWLILRSSFFADRFSVERSHSFEPPPPEDIDRDAIYYDVAKTKKGRVFGTGLLGTVLASKCSSSTDGPSSSQNARWREELLVEMNTQMAEKVEEAVRSTQQRVEAEMRERMEADIRARMEAEMSAKMEAEMRTRMDAEMEKMRELVRQLAHHPPPP
ncbi:hypothetical protein CASFOL_022609 [Castilleja foliolosa]|uniref:Transposase-associated domain-containing protein n=1 Tax=Castilleja foliolosa TaxID=1961234 RepID=A0ABD3CWK2_9LAMI